MGGDGCGDEFFEFDDIGGELADAFGGFFGGHGVFVEIEAEGFFVIGPLSDVHGGGGGWVEFPGERFGAGVEFSEECGGDGEEVAACEFGDFADVAEAGAHDFGGVAEFLVVVVDGGDGDDAWVFVRCVVFFGGGLVPVEDAADEWGDEFDAGVCAGDGLGEGEEEGEIAVDAFLLKSGGGLDAFPCGGDFDEDAIAGDAVLFVHGDELAGLGDGAGGIEREAGVDFSGDAAGDDFEDFLTEEDEDAVDDAFDEGVGGEGGTFEFCDGLIDEGAVLRFFRGLEDEGWVGGGVLGEEGAHGFEVTGVCDYGGELLEGFELSHGILRNLGSDAIGRTGWWDDMDG